MLNSTYDQLEDRHRDDVIIGIFLSRYDIKQMDSMLPFVCLVIQCISQKTSECGKNIGDTLGCQFFVLTIFWRHL